ncbi:peptidase inhibitor family I36 protein [Streptomyces sp. NPDC050617]|uniref:peptidase inhibitor family I36 protein n=1 Tax=Streptomyces sp. NPDC050617 TaxID=3154628 RepID=UPI003446ED67
MNKTAVVATLAAAAAVLLPPTAAAVPTSAPAPRLGACAAGQVCLWPKSGFHGARQTHDLTDTDIDSCEPLPAGASAASLANRTSHPVTAYQSAECAETGEFSTYPPGAYTPESPYRVRAFKIWER